MDDAVRTVVKELTVVADHDHGDTTRGQRL